MKLAIHIATLTLSGLLAAPPAVADIYVYRDANGVINYTNIQPTKNRVKIDKIYREPRRNDRPQRAVTYQRAIPLPAARPPAELRSIITEAAGAYKVDEALVQAIIQTESAYNTYAISPKGARGLMQLMPATALRYGVRNTFDPEQNIWGGVRYMRDLLIMFNQDVKLAVAAYNAGENAVIRHGGVPPYDETRNYVQRVMELHLRYQAG
jgi:soluble lytic murein transglycosylase-like protein